MPATSALPDDIAGAKRMAAEVGYPLVLKASWGGGGRGEMDDVFITHPHQLLHQLLVLDPLRLLVAQTLLLVFFVLGVIAGEEGPLRFAFTREDARSRVRSCLLP